MSANVGPMVGARTTPSAADVATVVASDDGAPICTFNDTSSATRTLETSTGLSPAAGEVPFCAWFEMNDGYKNGLSGRHKTEKCESCDSKHITHFEVKSRYDKKVQFQIEFTYEDGTTKKWSCHLDPNDSRTWSLETNRVTACRITDLKFH
jgi:hypothetical protein